jgi:hypothetical protein
MDIEAKTRFFAEVPKGWFKIDADGDHDLRCFLAIRYDFNTDSNMVTFSTRKEAEHFCEAMAELKRCLANFPKPIDEER